MLGLLFFLKTIDNENIIARSKKALLHTSALFLVFFLGKRALCVEDPPVQLLYFYSEECEDCHFVTEFILEPLKEFYPINVNHICVDDKERYERLIFMEEIIGDTENQNPVIILENKVMGGVEEIEAHLEQTIIDFIEAAHEEK